MTTNKYSIDLAEFSGPLDLLLHLIDRKELDITSISLARVTEQYLTQVEQLKNGRVMELIDFLVVGARLVLIKSRALLPQTPSFSGDEEEEEDPAEALIRQLRTYKQYKQAAKWLQEREESGLRTYLRVAPPPKIEGRLDLSGISVQSLLSVMYAALSRTETMEESVALIQPARITIQGQIKRLRHRVQQNQQLQFEELLSPDTSGIEVAITLLAVLELIKRREIMAVQKAMFGPIEIRAAKHIVDKNLQRKL